MAAAGPKPGNTPTKVPINTPKKQYKRFSGCKATLKPYKTPDRTSIVPFLRVYPQDPGGKLNLQPELEKNVAKKGSQKGGNDDYWPPLCLNYTQKKDNQKEGAKKESQLFQQEQIEQESCQGIDYFLPVSPLRPGLLNFLLFSLSMDSLDHEQQGQNT